MSVKIKISDIEMTPKEAREVYMELKELFAEQETAPYNPYYPYTVPGSPSVPQQPWYSPEITCGKSECINHSCTVTPPRGETI